MVITVPAVFPVLEDGDTKANFGQMVMCMILACCYLGIAFFSSWQLAKIIFYRHNCASFQVPFVMLSFLWTSIRAIFFGLHLKLSQKALFGIFWVTNDLELTMYYLIVVFYIYWIKDEDAERRLSLNTKRFRLGLQIMWGILVLVMFIKTFVTLSLCEDSGCNTETGDAAHVQKFTYFVRAVEYLILAVVYTFIMILIQYRRRKLRISAFEIRVRDGLTRHGTLKNTVVGRKLMTMFWLIFTTRCIFYFASTNGKVWTLDITMDENQNKRFGIGVFILLFLWEILPTVMVLWCFSSIPTTNAGGCSCLFWGNPNFIGDYESDGRYRSKIRPKAGQGITRNRDSSVISISSSITMNQPSLPISCSPPILQADTNYQMLEGDVINSRK